MCLFSFSKISGRLMTTSNRHRLLRLDKLPWQLSHNTWRYSCGNYFWIWFSSSGFIGCSEGTGSFGACPWTRKQSAAGRTSAMDQIRGGRWCPQCHMQTIPQWFLGSRVRGVPVGWGSHQAQRSGVYSLQSSIESMHRLTPFLIRVI